LKKFQSRKDRLKQKKELYIEKRAKQLEQLEEQSATGLESLQALDIKGCILEIQLVMLRNLAAEGNYIKGFA
jgi:hypothetical protein